MEQLEELIMNGDQKIEQAARTANDNIEMYKKELAEKDAEIQRLRAQLAAVPAVAPVETEERVQQPVRQSDFRYGIDHVPSPKQITQSIAN